jgi:UDP-glucose 4-epimerase
MESVLVTGGAGFVGANACNVLAQEGYRVVALDTLTLGKKDNLDPRVTLIEGDAGRPEDLRRAGSVEYIVHLAASSSSPMFLDQLADSVLNNIRGHLAVLEFARAQGVKKVLFASTSSIYGNNKVPLTEDQNVTPPNFYAVSKHAQEEISAVYHQTYGTEIIGFRFMSVYGPHEEHKGRFANLVSQFIWGMEQGRSPVIYGDGSQTRDFTHVRDVAKAFLLALRTPKRFGSTIFNVGTANAVNMRELVALINKVMGTSVQPSYVTNPIGDSYIASQQADLSKIERELGYAPSVTLEEGIREIVAYRKRHPVAPASMSY